MHGNTKDLTGKVFGRLTVISQAASDKCGHARWLCQCECGKEKIISSSSLIEGSTQSCGCLRNERLTASKKPVDLSGQRFGRLVAVKAIGRASDGCAMWLCNCDCGRTAIVHGSRLRCGKTTSCGCKVHGAHTHGQTVNCVTMPRLYRIWVGMKQRCLNPNRPKWHRYGGRGIKVCEAWRNDYMSFRNWALNNGYQEDLTIDRIDNDGDYEPDNCRWVTVSENSYHRWETTGRTG